jgi:hypothetical protein
MPLTALSKRGFLVENRDIRQKRNREELCHRDRADRIQACSRTWSGTAGRISETLPIDFGVLELKEDKRAR